MSKDPNKLMMAFEGTFELDRRVQEEADRNENKNKSEVMRKAVRAYLEKVENGKT